MQYKMIDLHCHILPDVDDGVKSEEEMLSVLKSAWQQGIYAMFTTSHYPGKKGCNERVRKEKLLLAKEAAKKISSDFQLYMGNEIFWMNGITEALESGRAATLADSCYVLIEFYPEVEYRQIYRAVQELTQAGYFPILAHIERYLCLAKEWEKMEKLKDAGAYFQMNMASLLGNRFHPLIRYHRRILQEEWIHFMGTDTHGMYTRPIELEKAYQWIYRNCRKEYANQILYQNAEWVIENKILQD